MKINSKDLLIAGSITFILSCLITLVGHISFNPPRPCSYNSDSAAQISSFLSLTTFAFGLIYYFRKNELKLTSILTVFFVLFFCVFFSFVFLGIIHAPDLIQSMGWFWKDGQFTPSGASMQLC